MSGGRGHFQKHETTTTPISRRRQMTQPCHKLPEGWEQESGIRNQFGSAHKMSSVETSFWSHVGQSKIHSAW